MSFFLGVILPVGAFLISLISIFLSLSNRRFSRRYEAVKKRTELIAKFVMFKSLLTSKLETLRKLQTICGDCPSGKTTEIIEGYEGTINTLAVGIEKLENNETVSDPIAIELIISKTESTLHDIKTNVDKIDLFIRDCESCKLKKEKEESARAKVELL